MTTEVHVSNIPTALDKNAFNVINYRLTSEDMYFLDDPSYARQLEFFKHATGIHDPIELKKHVLAIAAYAFDIFPYPCIRATSFCDGKVMRNPISQHIFDEVARTESHIQPIFIDIGCFFGTDLRQIVHAGFSEDNVLGVDVKDVWAQIGEKLFKGSGFQFLKGNILDNNFFDLQEPSQLNSKLNTNPTETTSYTSTDINLSSIKTLTELRSRARFITANMFFHLFDEAGQLELAHRFSALLDNTKGSVIFGCQCGVERSQMIHEIGERGLFSHSPQSWKQMWLKIYRPEQVSIKAELRDFGAERLDQIPGMENVKLLWWSVTVL